MITDLITISEFCILANTGRTNAYKLINAGQLKAVKLGRKTLIRKSDLDTWIASLSPYSAKQSQDEVSK